jgi:hypothetical protein
LEDLLVRQAEQMCRDLRDHAKQQARCGLAALNLPHDTKQDRQAHVRNTFRTTKDDDPLSLLPPAWQRAYKLAFLEPEESLGGTGVSPMSLPQAFGGSVASGGMADSSVSDGGSASDSALPHPAGEGTGKIPAPPPESEKMEYETAEKPSYSQASVASEWAVSNDYTITCDVSGAAESTPESHSIPRNILGGTGVSPVSLPQANSDSIAPAGMVDGTKVDGGLASSSVLPHQPAEDTGRIPVPPNIMGMSEPVFDEQAACDAISAALERRQRQRRLAKARRK